MSRYETKPDLGFVLTTGPIACGSEGCVIGQTVGLGLRIVNQADGFLWFCMGGR